MNKKIPSTNKRISIIIPVINEASTIVSFLEPLQFYRHQGHEIILVDGGSTDKTISLAQQYIDRCVTSNPGRATQMNLAASVAKYQVLLFLHSDTYLPNNADSLILNALVSENQWGRFNVKLSGNHLMFRVIETLINFRSCFSKIATGDQAIFVDKNVFNEIRGYPEIKLMEDVALCKKLRRLSPCACLDEKVITSSRRWEQYGIYRTILLMWYLRFSFYIGINPKLLYKIYYEKK